MRAAVSSVHESISNSADNSLVKSRSRWTKAKHQEMYTAQTVAEVHDLSFLQLFDADLHARVIASSTQHHHFGGATFQSQHFAGASNPRDKENANVTMPRDKENLVAISPGLTMPGHSETDASVMFGDGVQPLDLVQPSKGAFCNTIQISRHFPFSDAFNPNFEHDLLTLK